MKAPKCPQDGRFMRYTGRWGVGRSTVPLGWFICTCDFAGALVLPWDWTDPRVVYYP